MEAEDSITLNEVIKREASETVVTELSLNKAVEILSSKSVSVVKLTFGTNTDCVAVSDNDKICVVKLSDNAITSVVKLTSGTKTNLVAISDDDAKCVVKPTSDTVMNDLSDMNAYFTDELGNSLTVLVIDDLVSENEGNNMLKALVDAIPVGDSYNEAGDLVNEVPITEVTGNRSDVNTAEAASEVSAKGDPAGSENCDQDCDTSTVVMT